MRRKAKHLPRASKTTGCQRSYRECQHRRYFLLRKPRSKSCNNRKPLSVLKPQNKNYRKNAPKLTQNRVTANPYAPLLSSLCPSIFQKGSRNPRNYLIPAFIVDFPSSVHCVIIPMFSPSFFAITRARYYIK